MSRVPTLLRPRWLVWHGALVLVLVAFTLLGRWQLGSFEHSGDDAAADRTPVALSAVTAPGGRLAAGDVGTAVRASGQYDEAMRLLVPGRRLDGRTGYLVVAPLRLRDGGVLPVLRGWVAGPGAAAAQSPAGPVTVTGVLTRSESERDSAVDPLDVLPAGQVPYVATVLLLEALPVSDADLVDGYLTLAGERPAPAAAPVPVEPEAGGGGVSRWRNLAYALQWWLFAGAATFFWWSVIRRSAREREPAPSEP